MNPSTLDRVAAMFAKRKANRREAVKAGALTAGAGLFGLAAVRQTSAQDSTPTAETGATPSADADLTPREFLFVQSFQSGSLTAKDGNEDTFVLTLDQGLGQTIYFSDRPDRVVGASPTQQFLAQFPFGPDNPPNAALVMEVTEDDTDVVVMELTSPAYDQATKSATYEAKVLSDYERLDTEYQEKPKGRGEIHAAFGAASLFIDDCPDATIDCNVNPIEVPDGDPGNLGKHGMCYDWGAVQCRPCGGIDQYTALCNSTFPDDCQGKCTASPECSNSFCS